MRDDDYDGPTQWDRVYVTRNDAGIAEQVEHAYGARDFASVDDAAEAVSYVAGIDVLRRRLPGGDVALVAVGCSEPIAIVTACDYDDDNQFGGPDVEFDD